MGDDQCRSGHAALGSVESIDPDAELWAALQKMDRDGVNQLPVIRNQHAIGMLSREDVITFLGNVAGIGSLADMTTETPGP